MSAVRMIVIKWFFQAVVNLQSGASVMVNILDCTPSLSNDNVEDNTVKLPFNVCKAEECQKA